MPPSALVLRAAVAIAAAAATVGAAASSNGSGSGPARLFRPRRHSERRTVGRRRGGGGCASFFSSPLAGATAASADCVAAVIASSPRGGGEEDAVDHVDPAPSPAAAASTTREELSFFFLPGLAWTLANVAAAAFVGSGCAGAILASWILADVLPIVVGAFRRAAATASAAVAAGTVSPPMAAALFFAGGDPSTLWPLAATVSSLLIDSEVGWSWKKPSPSATVTTDGDGDNDESGDYATSASIRYPPEESIFLASLWAHALTIDPAVAGAVGLARTAASACSKLSALLSRALSGAAAHTMGSSSGGGRTGDAAAAVLSGMASACSSLAVASSVPRHFLGLYLLASTVVARMMADDDGASIGKRSRTFIRWCSEGLLGAVVDVEGEIEGSGGDAYGTAAEVNAPATTNYRALAARLLAAHVAWVLVKGFIVLVRRGTMPGMMLTWWRRGNVRRIPAPSEEEEGSAAAK